MYELTNKDKVNDTFRMREDDGSHLLECGLSGYANAVKRDMIDATLA